MMRFVYLFQSLFDHMSINLCGGYVGMAEHHLDGTKIGATIQQMCCKAVAQHMRRESLAKRGLPPVEP